jgi:hypothetical protein
MDTRHQHLSLAYVALSHCWGSQSFLCTTSQNIQAHKNGIRYLDLPRTFQNAVTVALEMKAMYLWIDSLCIIQDQEDDWARHAEKMDKIYENALFVAAAVSSSASSVPFLGIDAPTDRHFYRAVDIELTTTKDRKDGDLAPIIKARKQSPRLRPEWVTGPLEDRAWAFQERYCAVRIISFTEMEAKWQCKMSVGCECLGGLKNRDHKPRSPGDDDLVAMKEWQEVCSEYSRRNLTYNTDRLPALAGIASRFHHRLGSNYIAGLWELELPFNLGWYRRDLTDSPQVSYPIFPAMSNGVPTWSWASNFWEPWWLWEHYHDFGLEENATTGRGKAALDRKSCVEIVRVDCFPNSANEFGMVNPGSFIELRGRVMPATMECDTHGRASVSREGFNAQVVILDCKATSFTTSTNGELGRSMRRHTGLAPDDSQTEGSKGIDVKEEAEEGDEDEDEKEEGEPDEEEEIPPRDHGNVLCLLLYTGSWGGISRACVLILGQVENAGSECYQRLGLGSGVLENWSGPYYGHRRTWALWQGWENLEEWPDWEKWFMNAEVKTLRII